jgi:uncharacterized protein (DUF58 family)
MATAEPSTRTHLAQADLAAAHQRARAYAGALSLPFRHHVWKGRSGDFAGAGAGSSLDFQDHRNYVPGDDPRHINWQAFARTGNYSMKLYREEVRPFVDLVYDVSASMFFDPDKAARSLDLFYFCAESAARGAASVQVYLVEGEGHRRIPVEAFFGGAWTAGAASAPGSPAARDQPPRPPALGSLPLRPQSLRVLVSDLLFPGAPGPVTSVLASRRGRAVVLAPACRAESAPGWDGNYDFIDPEVEGRHPRRVEPPLLARYLDAYRRHFGLWEASCTKHGLVFARVPAGLPFERAVHQEAVPRGAMEAA